MDYTTFNISGTDELILVAKEYYPYIGNKSYIHNRTSSEDSNYSDSTASKLKQSVEKISLCNIHATDAVSVDLYSYYTIVNQGNDPSRGQYNTDNTLDVVADTYETYYLLNSVVIPSGVTLHLDKDDICYDSFYSDLYIKLGHSSSTVDAIVKTKSIKY